MMVVQQREYTKYHSIVHFRMVNFMSNEFHLNKFLQMCRGVIIISKTEFPLHLGSDSSRCEEYLISGLPQPSQGIRTSFTRT